MNRHRKSTRLFSVMFLNEEIILTEKDKEKSIMDFRP